MEVKPGKLATTMSCGVVLLVLYLIKAYRRRHHVSVKDKIIIITGATSGVGEACARKFFEAGAKLILCSRRASELERVKKELMEQKDRTPGRPDILHEPRVVTIDLEKLEEVPRQARQALACYGHVDVILNNAGISYRGEVTSTDLAVDIKLMKVNYLGQVALTKVILPEMIKRRSGHVVAVSSMQGKLAIPFRSCYAASKHAMQAFCDTLRAEVAAYNVQVSVVSPGYIQTNLSSNAVTGDGSQYGKVDASTASGMSADHVASRILDCVCGGEREVLLAPLSNRMAAYLRNLLPSIYFAIMAARAKKQRTSRQT